jgi:hypothetical protein
MRNIAASTASVFRSSASISRILPHPPRVAPATAALPDTVGYRVIR